MEVWQLDPPGQASGCGSLGSSVRTCYPAPWGKGSSWDLALYCLGMLHQSRPSHSSPSRDCNVPSSAEAMSLSLSSPRPLSTQDCEVLSKTNSLHWIWNTGQPSGWARDPSWVDTTRGGIYRSLHLILMYYQGQQTTGPYPTIGQFSVLPSN